MSRVDGSGEVMRSDDTGFILKRELTKFGEGLDWEEGETEKNQ